MKYLVRFFVVTSLFLICTYASAEQKIAFIDMKFILNNSKAGKGAQDYLKKTFEESQENLNKQEKNLKKEESDLLSKKSTLTKEEYKTKSDELRKKVVEYQTQRRSSIENIGKERAAARKKLLDKLNPILTTYAEETGISIIVDKKNVVLGNNNYDITKVIIEKLNKDLPSLKLN